MNITYKLVVGADYRFKDAKEDEMDEQPSSLVEKNLSKYCMFIAPMRLDREEESISFIQNSIAVFKPEIESIKYCQLTPREIYESLVRIDLIYIDAYWLVRLLAEHSLLKDGNNNIVKIYDTIILKLLPITEDVKYAAKIAYNFFCTNEFQKVVNSDGAENQEKSNKIWEVIRKHKSVLDYLVAKHYIELLKNLQFDQPTERLKIQLEFFNRVFPKNITRFASKMIKVDEELEEKILKLAENEYYDMLDVTAQSELTYWLGRLSDDSQEKAFDALKKLKKKAKAACLEKNNKDVKINNFLLRGIYVSLLYCKNVKKDVAFYADKMQILNEYIKLLFSDKIADEVNRAFHLEYYNDISYKLRPKSNDLIKQMKDNLAVGRNTFRKLTLDLDLNARKDKDEYDCVNVLQLVTFCSLILARKPEKIDCEENCERDGGKKFYYVKKITENYSEFETKNEYIKIYDIYDDLVNCIIFMETLEKCPIYRELDKQVVIYLNWAKAELKWLKEELDRAKVKDGAYFIPFIETRTYNLYSRTSNVLRTGWLQRNVGRAESVAEHIYNCWFMGLLYLPEIGTETEKNEGYNKAAILSTLLIHDLGEVITGDIPRDIKTATNLIKQKYDEEENLAMYSMLLTGAYPFVNSTMHEYYDVWDAWVNLKSKRNINAEIAKDIDNIQAVYQYCLYYLHREHAEKTNRNERLTIFNGNNEPVLQNIDYVNITKEDCIRWLSTVDPDKNNKNCILLNGRGKEISQKVIFENLEFKELIIDYKASKTV